MNLDGSLLLNQVKLIWRVCLEEARLVPRTVVLMWRSVPAAPTVVSDQVGAGDTAAPRTWTKARINPPTPPSVSGSHVATAVVEVGAKVIEAAIAADLVELLVEAVTMTNLTTVAKMGESLTSKDWRGWIMMLLLILPNLNPILPPSTTSM